MKHLSTLLLFIGLFWTWQMARSEAPVSVRTHYDIQTDLSRIIEATIKSHLPNSSNLKFNELFTETIDAQNVKATFRYGFNDELAEESTQTGISGTALIERDPSNPQQWILKSIEVGESRIEFKKGTVVTNSPEEKESSGQ